MSETRTEINDTENKKTISETNGRYFERISKINNILPRLIKKKKKNVII